MSQERFHFFWKSSLSQWETRHNFTVGGLTFNCAEQFMMFGKAILFADYEAADEVMAEMVPKEQQTIGRRVKNFNQKTWDKWREAIVYVGNFARATQNPDLLKTLLDTDCDTFVEASPFDSVWGIKLAKTDPRAQSRETWNGLNLLGKALTEVRDTLRDPMRPHPRHNDRIELISQLIDNYLLHKKGFE